MEDPRSKIAPGYRTWQPGTIKKISSRKMCIWPIRPFPENREKLPLPDKQYDDKEENGNPGERKKDFTNG